MNQECAKLFTRISSLVVFITFLRIRKSAQGPGVIFSVEVWFTSRLFHCPCWGPLCVQSLFLLWRLLCWPNNYNAYFTLLLSLITLQFTEVWGPVSPIQFSQFCCCCCCVASVVCYPRDGSPPGSPVPGILQARTLEWVAISFSNAWKWKVTVKSLSRSRLLATPWTAALQSPLSMDFPGKNTGVGCHCLLR